MFNKSNNRICISLTDDVIRVVEVKGAGAAAKVTRVSSRDVKGLSETELPKVIRSAVAGFNLKSSLVISVVPTNSITTKNIEIPSTNPEEIKSIVSLQAGRHTPFSREEIQIGYVNLGVFKATFSKVLLVIANKATLKKQMTAFDKAGIKIKKTVFSPESIAYFYGQVIPLADSSKVVGVIDVSTFSTDLIITLNGKALSTRNIAIGKSQLSMEGPGAKDRLVDEIKKTVDAYQSEDIEKLPSEYILTTDDLNTKEIQDALKSKFGWEARIGVYLDGIKATSDVSKKISIEFASSSFLDVISSALCVGSLQVNLVPDEHELQKSIEDQGKEVFRLFAMGFICLVLFACMLYIKIYFRDSALKGLKTKYKGTHDQVVDLENKNINTMVMEKFLKSRMISLDIINELYRNIPREIYLTSISMNESGHVTVQGISDVPSLVYDLVVTLKESALFKSVDITSTSSKKDRGKDVSVFDMVLKLQSAEDDAPKTEEAEENP